MNRDIKVMVLFLFAFLMLSPLCIIGYVNVENKDIAITMCALGSLFILIICYMASNNKH